VHTYCLTVGSRTNPHDAVALQDDSSGHSETYPHVLPDDQRTEEMRKIQEASSERQHWARTDTATVEEQARERDGARRRAVEEVYIKSEHFERQHDEYWDSVARRRTVEDVYIKPEPFERQPDAFRDSAHGSSPPLRSSPPHAPGDHAAMAPLSNDIIDIFSLCLSLNQRLNLDDIRILLDLQNRLLARDTVVSAALHSNDAGAERWHICGAENTQMAMFGSEQDPVKPTETKAMACGSGSPLYTHRPMKRTNTPASRAAITALQCNRCESTRNLRAPQIDHHKPQREELSRNITFTLRHLSIPRTLEAISTANYMLTKFNKLLKHKSGPSLIVALVKRMLGMWRLLWGKAACKVSGLLRSRDLHMCSFKYYRLLALIRDNTRV
jgi:hypothetical protein